MARLPRRCGGSDGRLPAGSRRCPPRASSTRDASCRYWCSCRSVLCTSTIAALAGAELSAASSRCLAPGVAWRLVFLVPGVPGALPGVLPGLWAWRCWRVGLAACSEAAVVRVRRRVSRGDRCRRMTRLEGRAEWVHARIACLTRLPPIRWSVPLICRDFGEDPLGFLEIAVSLMAGYPDFKEPVLISPDGGPDALIALSPHGPWPRWRCAASLAASRWGGDAVVAGTR